MATSAAARTVGRQRFELRRAAVGDDPVTGGPVGGAKVEVMVQGYGPATIRSRHGPVKSSARAVVAATVDHMSVQHVDVLVIGAGISGIGAAYHLQVESPNRTYLILEGRADIGGTWDLFRYPGIRSDSDMHTLGFEFKPWNAEKSIADGPSIMAYLRETIAEFGIDRHIRFGHQVRRAEWSSDTATWTVEADLADGGTGDLHAAITSRCARATTPTRRATRPNSRAATGSRAGSSTRKAWPEDLDYDGQAGRGDRLGSHGDDARAGDGVDRRARHDAAALADLRGRRARRRQDRQRPAQGAARQGRLRDHPQEEHRRCSRSCTSGCARTRTRRRASWSSGPPRRSGPTTTSPPTSRPSYAPWDQRLCLVPNGDLFEAIKDGSASVVTDHIDTFDETGIALRSGEHLDADIIVTATGLEHGDARRGRLRRRRRAGRLLRDDRLQGLRLLRRAEPGVDVRLRQRLVDAARRPDRPLRVPAAQPHGRDRHRRSARRGCGRPTRRWRPVRCSTTSRPATSSAPPIVTRSRAIASHGSTRRTTPRTRRCSARHPSTTASCSFGSRQGSDPRRDHQSVGR